MTASDRHRTPRCHSCGSRNPLSDFQTMDSRVRGNDSKGPPSKAPLFLGKWIPAFAGMTARAAVKRSAVIPTEAGIHSHSNNGFPCSRE
ncbi:hypothetical protein QUF72_04315 [Desulfobacterales bacterium HSG2]|nr:hypothetical protein [Desulfobacterales bacterium HSG2]